MRLSHNQKIQLQEWLFKKCLRALRIMKFRCAVDKGRLRSSLIVKRMPEYRVQVGTPVEYAPHIEYGTGPHIIEPKDAEALHWKNEENEDVYAKRVRHPGTNPQPFLRPALDEVFGPTNYRQARLGL